MENKLIALYELFNDHNGGYPEWQIIGIFDSIEKISVDLSEQRSYVYGFSNERKKSVCYRTEEITLNKLF